MEVNLKEMQLQKINGSMGERQGQGYSYSVFLKLNF